MDARKAWVSGAASGTLMMGSSERMRVPIGIFRVATSPLPFPGTSRSVHIRSVAEIDIFRVLSFRSYTRAAHVLSCTVEELKTMLKISHGKLVNIVRLPQVGGLPGMWKTV